MWTVWMLAADAIPLATGPLGRLFPGGRRPLEVSPDGSS
jgi:hypothetical protein